VDGHDRVSGVAGRDTGTGVVTDAGVMGDPDLLRTALEQKTN